MLLREFHVSAFGDLAFAVTLFAVATRQLHLDWTVPKVLFLLTAVLGGALLEGGIQMVMAATAFRTEAADILMTWTDNRIMTFAHYPVTIFPWAVRVAFMTVFPIAFIAFFPASVILGRTGESPVTAIVAYGAPALDLAAFVLACMWWTRSVLRYQSKGA